MLFDQVIKLAMQLHYLSVSLSVCLSVLIVRQEDIGQLNELVGRIAQVMPEQGHPSSEYILAQ